MKKLKALRGAWSEKEGAYVTERERGGIIEKPFRYGNKVIWMGESRAGRMKEEIKSIEQEYKKAHSKRAAKERRKAKKEGIQYEKLEVTNIRLQKQTARVEKKIITDNYLTRTENYLARMPAIVNGMKRALHGDALSRAAVQKFLDEFNKLSMEERIKFYEDNQDLFVDMSDYYNYIKAQSERISGEDIPEGFDTAEQYVQTRIDEIDYITDKLIMQRLGKEKGNEEIIKEEANRINIRENPARFKNKYKSKKNMK